MGYLYRKHPTMYFLRTTAALACLTVIGLFSRCSPMPSGPVIAYPSPAPDTAALPFMPGIVCSDSLDFNAAFSPDLQSFYFTRRLKKWVMLVTHYDGTKWTEPVRAPFADTRYAEADATFGPDGAVYFISNRPKRAGDSSGDYDIWRKRPLANGSWSEAENVTAINSDSTEYYISFAANGNLYFASFRRGGMGEGDIYVSKWVNGQYTKPENLGPAINSPLTEHDPCVSPQEDYLVFTAADRKEGFGEADLYGAKRTGQKWCTAMNLGSRVNTPTYEYCSYFSPDGQYFFFSSNFDVKWVKASAIRDDIDKLCK
ncbi:TolB family protein [Paraflavitalea soli]|nr:PD40 domain-containing protein [Paraflavitalea soli]